MTRSEKKKQEREQEVEQERKDKIQYMNNWKNEVRRENIFHLRGFNSNANPMLHDAVVAEFRKEKLSATSCNAN